MKPEVEGGVRRSTQLLRCVPVCACPVWCFPRVGKKSSDSENRCLSCQCSLDEAIKRAAHACAVLVAQEACRIAVGH